MHDRSIINSIIKMGGNILCKQSVHNILSEINHRMQKKWFRNNSKIPQKQQSFRQSPLILVVSCFEISFPYIFHIFKLHFSERVIVLLSHVPEE